MAAKRTPGPWESDDTQKYYQGHVIRNNGMIVCRMLDLGYASHGDRQANARLIAEAPAMRGELSETLNILRTIIDSGALKTATNLSEAQKDAIRNEVHERIASQRALLARIDGDNNG